MSDKKARVTTSSGQVIGYFVNPKVEHLCDRDWQIEGRFTDESGRPFEKVEFNPQAVPYFVDLSELDGVKVKTLKNGYVQKGRQPVCMTGISE